MAITIGVRIRAAPSLANNAAVAAPSKTMRAKSLRPSPSAPSRHVQRRPLEKSGFVQDEADDDHGYEREGSAPVNRGQAAFSASNSHRGFLPRHLGISAGGTGKLSISSIDQR